jgi:HemY protein
MIRIAVFLAVTAAFAFVAAWLADRPGEVNITWLGYHAETSMAVLIGVVALICCLAILLWSIVLTALRAPRRLGRARAHHRATRGQHAITKGLVAIGAGDMRSARRYLADATRHVPHEPLLLLLQAQTAQLAGERESADQTFRAMVERQDTKLLGLHGLFIEARRRNDKAAARVFADDAASVSPSLAWAGQAALEFRSMDGDWSGALDALERNRKGGLVDKDAFRRQRAVLLTAQALSLENEDRASARELALEAVKLAPGLVPAAALAGRLLSQAGERRRAGRILETAWREKPHPDLAAAYADIVPGISARDRLVRMRALRRLAESNVESAVAVAEAALDAREFAEARTVLAPLVATPTKRVATLMARIEEAERGDIGRAREWMARAVNAALDPAWTADGLVSETWLPVSPVTGRLDAFQWRVPFAELSPRGPWIEEVAPPARPAIEVQPEPQPEPAATTDGKHRKDEGDKLDALSEVQAEPKPDARTEVKPDSKTEIKLANIADRAAVVARQESLARTPVETPPALKVTAEPASVDGPEPIAGHAPDDPGPEPEPSPDPVRRRKPDNGGILRSWFYRGDTQ